MAGFYEGFIHKVSIVFISIPRDNECMKNKALYLPTFVKVKKKGKMWVLWKLWFPSAQWNKVVIPFGKKIYSPENEVPADLMVHENTHLCQQGYSYWGAIKWHLKYRASAKFRYEQEVQAYGLQLSFIRSKLVNRKYRGGFIHQWRHELGKLLSGKMYGGIATYDQAVEAIDQASY